MKQFLAVFGSWHSQEDKAVTCYKDTILHVGIDFFLETKNGYSQEEINQIRELQLNQAFQQQEGNQVIIRIQ